MAYDPVLRANYYQAVAYLAHWTAREYHIFTTHAPMYNKIFCNNHKMKNSNNADSEIFHLLDFVHIIMPVKKC